MTSFLKTEITGFMALAVISVVLGVGGNFFGRESPLPLGYVPKAQRLEKAVERLAAAENPKPIAPAEPTAMEVDEFQKRVEGKSALILDARPAIFHKMGHVPGALSLPRDDFEKSYAVRRSELESAKEREIVVYCSDASCTDSDLVAKSLIQLGYHRVSVFNGGWELWTQLGMPEEKP